MSALTMADDIVDRITQHVETHHADALQRINTFLTRLQVSCSHRRLVVARMGSTGSTWLAKLLNSHPDVFCSHEFVVAQVYPAREYGVPDVERLIEHLATDLHAWRVLRGGRCRIGVVRLRDRSLRQVHHGSSHQTSGAHREQAPLDRRAPFHDD